MLAWKSFSVSEPELPSDESGLYSRLMIYHIMGNPHYCQRKKLDRYFEREYYNVRVFGNEDVTSVVLRHALMVSTTMKHSETEQHFKGHTAQRDLFAAMPDKFKTAEILAEASVRGISRASVFRMLKKAQDYKLLISLGGGYYQKTESGKNVASSEIG